jgi:hypothetical protein
VPERRRAVLFAVLCAACVLGAAAAIASGMRGQDGAAPAQARTELPEAQAAGRATVLFRSLGGGVAKGRVAVAPLAEAGGRRRDEGLSCDRVHFAAQGAGICLARGKGFAAGYRARIFGPDMRVRHELGVEGIPSRARVSPDGRYGSVTLFVAGHSYAAEGAFSTQTTLIDMASGRKVATLEDFAVTREGRRITAIDVNFWGVTFARDSDRFYATLATGGKTYLIEGSIEARTARVLHENVECPSLSPDGTRIAYKRRTGSATTPWRETVLDLATMRETPLAETRSVDDQAEWVDDDTVAYGVDGDVWTVPADGSGEPRRLIADADSPAVVRY